MLDLEVIPERALAGGQWEFVLGMPLAQAVEILRRHCTAIKKVQLSYSEQYPLDMDLVLDLVQDGIKLIFDPKSQRLKMIEIYDVKKVKLKYCNSHFCSTEVTPTVEQIYHSFGHTHPGQVDTKQQLYIVLFRGILFAFPLWSDPALPHSSSSSSADFPTTTNKTSPISAPSPSSSLQVGVVNESPTLSAGMESQHSLVLSRVCIFTGNEPNEPKAPSLPMECFHGNCYGDSVEVVRAGGVISGLKLRVIADESRCSKLCDNKQRLYETTVEFGDSVQAVLCALGSPSKLFYKAEDKMRIHSPSPHKLPTARCSDYFYNYFTLGLDILFDATTHKIKKFVMHTNLPGHYNFNMCNFILKFPVDKQLSGDSDLSELSISPSTKWSEVQDYLTRPTDKPVVLNRSSSTNSINPFGSTYCYGYKNIIFEVMRNHHIASVTLYNHNTS